MNGLITQSSDEYFEMPYISQSYLKLFRDSPFHAKHPRNRKSTDDQIFGTRFHTLLLENPAFNELYAQEQEYLFDGRSKEGKQERAEFKEMLGIREPIKKTDWALLNRMHQATLADPIASQLFKAGTAEQSLVWKDELGGVFCKARLDWVPTDFPDLIVDVKTTANAHPDELQRSVLKWGYHIQEAFYRRGWEQTFGKKPDFIFSFHEKTKHPMDEPLPPVIIELDKAYRDAGEREVVRLMELF